MFFLIVSIFFDRQVHIKVATCLIINKTHKFSLTGTKKTNRKIRPKNRIHIYLSNTCPFKSPCQNTYQNMFGIFQNIEAQSKNG